MRKYLNQATQRLSFGVILLAAFLAFMLLQSNSSAKSDKAARASQMAAYKVYQQKCLGCHDSVADPEKPGRTRDEWHLVVNIMHGFGMEITDDEGDMIVDLLYVLRKGIEKDPG